jgi:TetR/AcrR family transcriptional regulator, ethionamide resistance regulator
MATRKVPSGRTRRNGVARDVIDATIRCLSAGENFTNLGIQRICDEAGVARSAFYKNFTDKTDLLHRVVSDATADLFDTACAWAAGTGGKTSMIAAQANTVRVWREHAPLLKAYFEAAGYEPEIAALWNDRLQEVVTVMRQRIKTGQRDGRVSTGLDAQTVAEFIVYGFERLTARHVASTPASADRAFVRSISEIGWALIYGQDTDPHPSRK